MRLPVLFGLLALAAGLTPAATSKPAASGTIVFASTRAASFIRPAVYTIGVDGRGRRRVTPGNRPGLAPPVM